MPPKLNLTPEEMAARKRAQSAARMKRYHANRSEDAREAAYERTRAWRASLSPDAAAARKEARNAKRNAETAEKRQDPNWRDGHRREIENISPLGIFIDEQRRITGMRYKELSVLSIKHDPFRFDTPSTHRDSKWVADQLGGAGPIHIRGLHYRIVARGDALKPNGTSYINDDECYAWLNDAVKSARWLGYVPFDSIVDNRNDDPVIALPTEETMDGYADWNPPDPIEMPEVLGEDWEPEIHLAGGHTAQPYRIILIGEKSSLRSELEPIREQVNAELILPTGELSDTLVYGMTARAAADGRPAVVLYFSDFDPSGYNMPVSLSRRLQALKTLYWPDLEIQVHAAALDLETCIRLDLPSTPLKETELRADKWRERFGREQTEIDALAALHPGELRRIAREAVAPFFDFTLDRRMISARGTWFDAAQELIDDNPAFQAEVDLLNERTNAAKATIVEAINDVNLSRQYAMEHIDDLGFEFELFTPPEIEITAEAPRPLFDSNDTWAEQTRRLKERKALAADDDDN